MSEPTFPPKGPGGTTRRIKDFVSKNIGTGQIRDLDTTDQKDKADVKSFNDNQLYGMTRRRVEISRNGAIAIVPEIVGHIDKNWNDEVWLISLLKRYGLNYETDIFDENSLNSSYPITGLDSGDEEKVKKEIEKTKVDLLRKILLRLAGMPIKDIRTLTDTYLSTERHNFFPFITENVDEKIKEIDIIRMKKK